MLMQSETQGTYKHTSACKRRLYFSALLIPKPEPKYSLYPALCDIDKQEMERWLLLPRPLR